MKIAIITHFGSFQPGYALHVGWLERAKLLCYFGQDFDFLVNESCPEELYPNQKSILPNIIVQADNGVFNKSIFDRKVLSLRHWYNKNLKQYDIILTADLLYQKRHNFLICNQALKHSNQDFIANDNYKQYYHWIHSGWTNDRHTTYPESIRTSEIPENFHMVYMNKSDLEGVAQMYNTENVSCVYNPKDFRSFNNFDPLSWQITVDMDLQNKDIVQLLPLCSTRMEAKGINPAIKTFGKLKDKGKKVALIIANSHAGKAQLEIDVRTEWAKNNYGLIHGKDFLFTSTMTDGESLNREQIADLFKVSNLFVFASKREVCPNVLLEAKINGCLLAINGQLPCAYEFGGEQAIYIEGCPTMGSGVPDGDKMHWNQKDTADYDSLADEIIKRVRSKKHIWEFSFEKIWYDQLKPLLQGG